MRPSTTQLLERLTVGTEELDIDEARLLEHANEVVRHVRAVLDAANFARAVGPQEETNRSGVLHEKR